MLAGYESSGDEEDQDQKILDHKNESKTIETSSINENNKIQSESIKSNARLFSSMSSKPDDAPKQRKKKKKKKRNFLPLLEEPVSIESDSESDFFEEDPKSSLSVKRDDKLVWDEPMGSSVVGPSMAAAADYESLVYPTHTTTMHDISEESINSRPLARMNDHEMQRFLEAGGDLSSLQGDFVDINKTRLFEDAKKIHTSKLEEEEHATMFKTMTSATRPVTQAMKRNNQLSALANHAQAMEAKIQEQRALSIKKGKEAKAQYGL